MKSILFLFFASLSIAIIFNSCEENDAEFSCVPEINNYVKNNKKSLSEISLDELNSYDIQLQRAVFNSWDQSKKRNAWIKKLSLLKENELLSPSEISHINKLVSHISLHYFHKDTMEVTEVERSNFADAWIIYASTDLEWSPEYIAFIVYRLYTKQEQFFKEMSEITQYISAITTFSEYSNCLCSTLSDWCHTGTCLSANCNIVGGCGWLWSYDCDGTCY